MFFHNAKVVNPALNYFTFIQAEISNDPEITTCQWNWAPYRDDKRNRMAGKKKWSQIKMYLNFHVSNCRYCQWEWIIPLIKYDEGDNYSTGLSPNHQLQSDAQ